MPTTRTWIGGSDNLATNPADWSPNGAPQPGDSLVINSGTINVDGGALSGDTLTAHGGAINLIDGGSADVSFSLPASGAVQQPLTFNLTPGSSLSFGGLYIGASVYATGGTIVSGSGYNIENDVTIAAGATLTVDSNGASHGGLHYTGPGVLDLEGGTGCTWDGPVIACGAVVGPGTINAIGGATIDCSVAPSITVAMSYLADPVILNDPTQFLGTIVEQYSSAATGMSGAPQEPITITGLQAASYSYANNAVTLYDGSGNPVYSLKLQTPYTVEADQTANGVVVWSGADETKGGTLLPVYTPPPTTPPPSGGGSSPLPSSPPSATPLPSSGPSSPPLAAPPVSSSPVIGAAGAVGGSQPPPQVGTQPPAATSPTSNPASGPITFTGMDLSTGQPLTGTGSVYANLTMDSLNISANIPGAFIMTGPGNDLISAAAGGNNVLDSTGGQVNVLTGGSGTDAFFLDASKSPVTWNTLAGFHAGDIAVIAGIGPQNVAANAQNGLGIPGNQGLTLETYQNGGAAFVTLAGYSSADLANGRLAVGFGGGNMVMMGQ